MLVGETRENDGSNTGCDDLNPRHARREQRQEAQARERVERGESKYREGVKSQSLDAYPPPDCCSKMMMTMMMAVLGVRRRGKTMPALRREQDR